MKTYRQPKINLIGRKFGELLVERRLGANTWLCTCSCGKTTKASTYMLLNKKITRCKNHSGSKGELLIAKILTENNIKFKRERTFTDLIYEDTGKHPRFDFYVFGSPSYIIEFDGKQHYMDITETFFDNDIELIKKRDKIKDQYCKEHNIPIIRIPYTIQQTLSIDDLQLETSNYIV